MSFFYYYYLISCTLLHYCNKFTVMQIKLVVVLHGIVWGQSCTWMHSTAHSTDSTFGKISTPIQSRIISHRTQISTTLNSTMDVQQLFKNLMKEAECPLCLETVKKSQDFAMSSLILLGMSRQIGRLRKKTA